MFYKKLIMTVAALITLAVSASANIAPPLEIKLAGEPRAAKFGEMFEGEFLITAWDSVSFDIDAIQAEGWAIPGFTDPGRQVLGRGDSIVVPFVGIPVDSFKFVSLSLNLYHLAYPLDSIKIDFVELYVDLSPWSFQVRNNTNGLLSLPLGDTIGITSPSIPIELEKTIEKSNKSDAAAQTILIKGRFGYIRDDPDNNFDQPVFIGCDSAKVVIVDKDMISREFIPDGISDDVLATVYTNLFGYFEVEVTSDDLNGPDLEIHFHLDNNAAKQHGQEIWWSTDVIYDYTDSELNFGRLIPADEGLFPLVHIFTDITRTQQFLQWNFSIEPLKLEIDWPAGPNGAWYQFRYDDPAVIGVGTGREWHEDSHAHEYGHHFIRHYATPVSPVYCNTGNYCDNDPSNRNCGHCLWCDENEHVAWSEGWPNWFAHVVTGTFHIFGEPSARRRNQEKLDICRDGLWDFADPWVTEGFMGALLQDIEDRDNEDEANTPGYADQLSLGIGPIFEVTREDRPTSPREFFDDFKARFPEYTERLWETGMNNMYDADEDPPGLADNLRYVFVLINLPDPDPVRTVKWDPAEDDWSGIDGYSIAINEGSKVPPDYVKDIGDVSQFRTGILAPGSYYFTIRTLDRSGKWSPGFAAYGPMIVEPPGNADLALVDRTGWTYPMVPRATADATINDCLLPSTLPGNAAVYWNASGKNVGSGALSQNITNSFYVDGEYQSGLVMLLNPPLGTPLNAGSPFFTLNLPGLLNIRGGRHTVYGKTDNSDVIAEDDEWDNFFGRQYVWTPLDLAEGVAVERLAPPEMFGGLEYCIVSPYIANSDGFRFDFDESGWWNAAVVRATNLEDDYDCRMHTMNDGPFNGFAGDIARSEQAAGYLDFVIVNNNTVGATQFDIGVVNRNAIGDDPGLYPPNDPFEIVHEASDYFIFGGIEAVFMANDQFLSLVEFEVPLSRTGQAYIYIDSDPSLGKIYAAWLSKDFTTGNVLDAVAIESSNQYGLTSLLPINSSSGYYCLVLWRNPIDIPGTEAFAREVDSIAPAIAFTISTGLVTGNPYPALESGWHSPMVVRDSADGINSSVPVPDHLTGDLPRTYLNAAVDPGEICGVDEWTDILNGDSAVGFISIDGVWMSDLYSDSIPIDTCPYDPIMHFTNIGPHTVTGGRHTVTLELMERDTIPEMSPLDNDYGEQYIWEPAVMDFDYQLTRFQPPGMIAGWESVRSGELLRYNCDGLRLNHSAIPVDSYYVALAAMPLTASGDIDLRLHKASSGAKDGFGVPLQWSTWGPGESDFVIVNLSLIPETEHDVGIIKASENNDNYTIQADVAEAFTPDTSGTYVANGTIGSNIVIDIFHTQLSAGWVIDIYRDSGLADLGLAVYPANMPYLSKSITLTNGLTFLDATDSVGYCEPDIPFTGEYIIAVFKRRASDLFQQASYRLKIRQGADCIDLAPEILSLSGDQAIAPGEPIASRLTAVVNNIGSADHITTTNIGFYLSDDQEITSSDLLITGGIEGIHPIPAGYYEIITLNSTMPIPDDYPLGPAWLGMILDLDDLVDECDETNNTYAIPVIIENSCGRKVLLANFNADTPDSPPDITLPGDPAGDNLILYLSQGTVLVRDAVGDLTNQPLELVKYATIPGSPGFSAYLAASDQNEDKYVVRWRMMTRYSENAFIHATIVGDAAGITSIRYTPSGFIKAFNGVADVATTVPYSTNVSQIFEIHVDFTTQTTSLIIDGSPVVGFQDVDFETPAYSIQRFLVSMGGLTHQEYSFDDLCITMCDTSCCVGEVGNVNCDPDDNIDLSDITKLIDIIYISKGEPCCFEEADINGDGKLDLSDITKLIDRTYISKTALRNCGDPPSTVRN